MKLKRGLDDVVCVCFKFDGLSKVGETDSVTSLTTKFGTEQKVSKSRMVERRIRKGSMIYLRIPDVFV